MAVIALSMTFILVAGGMEVYWLTDRLVFLTSDIGHAAGARHLFDVEEGRWLYRMGDRYR